MMYGLKRQAILLSAICCAWAQLALAEEGQANEPLVNAQSAANVPFGGAVVDPGSLDGQRGTADLLLTKMDLDSKVHENTLNVGEGATMTGTNTISGGAYSNFNGIAVGTQNNGSQVSIQNAVSVNIQLK